MSRHCGLTLLLIDTSVVVCRALRNIFKRDSRFSNIFEATDAAEGYSLFRVIRPEVVIVDFELMDLPGIEVLKMIKSVAPSCIAIMLISSEAPGVRERCLLHGADSVLNKEHGLLAIRRFVSSLDLPESKPSRKPEG